MALKEYLSGIADAIREKKGTTDAINAQDFESEIKAIQGGGESGITHTNGTQTIAVGKHTITIAHGLGKKPKFAVCFAKDYATISGVKTGCGFIYSEMMGISLKNFTSVGNFAIYGITVDGKLTGDYTTGRVYADDTYIYCEAGDSNWRGTDYNWEACTW